ncbi:MAG: discoidin domain-containing protein [Candidatus Aureabacteria bacterium]|nr:discoidin domain-containing protein [Candidatus Auribacterota bacterium]
MRKCTVLMFVCLLVCATFVSAELKIVDVEASSFEAPGLEAQKTIDGDSNSRWSSQFADDEWIYVDLGKVVDVSTVSISWETAYGSEYEIQISDDAINWGTVYTESNSDGCLDTVGINTKARYIKMMGLRRATEWGYSILEIEVE